MSRVQSIERAFAVLAVLAGGPGGVTEIAERVRLPKSTVARLLVALARERAVEQIPDGTDYRLGPGLVGLAGIADADGGDRGRTLMELAHPELEALATVLDESAGFGLLDGGSVRYVDHVDSDHPVSVRDWTGTRAPLHTVPSGLVLLAEMPAEAIDRYLAGPLERFTDRTMTDPDALRARLSRIARDGAAWCRDEYAEGISSVAAPVADARGHLVGAIHVHGPSYRFPVSGQEAAIAAEVIAAAARVSARARAGRTGQGRQDG